MNPSRSDEQPPAPRPFRVQPHAFGLRLGIDPDRLNRLVDELEVLARAAKLRD